MEHAYMKADMEDANQQIIEEQDNEITQEDAWAVIRAYANQHGLVSQQISSFDRFLSYTVQDIVTELSTIEIIPEKQYAPGKADESQKDIKYNIVLGQVRVNDKPRFKEFDDKYNVIFPNEARLRNLTYQTSIYVEVKKQDIITETDGSETIVDEDIHKEVYMGKVPVMVRSSFCSLNSIDETERWEMKECFYDQGGYFIINGGEKVIVAQERMANNFVYVFQKKQPSKFSWVAEIRSQVDSSNRPPSPFSVKMYSKGQRRAGGSFSGGKVFGQTI